MYGTPLTAVPLFKHLGRVLLSSDDYWTSVEHNLRWARGKWGQLMKLLGREGSYRRTMGGGYVDVVQAVLMFGSYTLVMTPWTDNSPEGFHHWVVRQMTGMGPKRQRDGT